jgi:REP element-mobilizing transposase RayT
MPNTFSQINRHIVFGVKNREACIPASIKENLYKYIAGIIKNKNQKLLAINGMPDHVHIFVSMNPETSVSELVREIKKHSTDYINEKKLLAGKFYWQEGYGAFSYSNSQTTAVIKYIMDQEKHHSIKTFREEYVKMLEDFQIEYDEKYLP